ncbi:DUF417 family protein [Capnocytophaga catalasegens]|uniref:Membrane protein n=1 Tax=Capnocytophaga catalasegens TaxID=1004260 RepID=A0AAV5AT25_9FLAO|nr:DUF417 family protein [Capnocytophaga catalasegens]GIZ15030.1 membrane protein [Capnocytophaga catalasegens]GJM49410.1 membrane protein [Capnocytophaga catalasegens]GJM52560.1 membrane protein [Capnocytophaga catalasegens]
MRLFSDRTEQLLYKIGYYISLFGIAIVLFWIGIFKFTPTEAKAIKPLVENHFLMSWLYSAFSEQEVSNIIGIIEISTAILLVMSLFSEVCRKITAMFIILTFVFTLSFLLTTPNQWRIVDGIPITDFFILKDIAFLGFGLMFIKSLKNKFTERKKVTSF